MQVYHQHRNGLCGFYAYHNAKCFMRAILADNQTERMTQIMNTQVSTKYARFILTPYRFWSSYNHTIGLLLGCTNQYYVSDTDKKHLREDTNPLERSHLRYLLMKDPEILEILANQSGCEVFIQPFLYAFGLFQNNTD